MAHSTKAHAAAATAAMEVLMSPTGSQVISFWNWPAEANSSAEKYPISMVFLCAINSAHRNSIGAMARANVVNPCAIGSNTSMMIKAGMVERLKIKVAATAIGTAGAMVASRVVATAPRIAAVGPCAQSARIQNPLTKKTASAARTPVHSAPTGSFAWVKRIGREAVLGAKVKAS